MIPFPLKESYADKTRAFQEKRERFYGISGTSTASFGLMDICGGTWITSVEAERFQRILLGYEIQELSHGYHLDELKSGLALQICMEPAISDKVKVEAQEFITGQMFPRREHVSWAQLTKRLFDRQGKEAAPQEAHRARKIIGEVIAEVSGRLPFASMEEAMAFARGKRS